MRTTIDNAGRIVIPRSVRDAIGLVPGEVDVVVDGASVRISPVAGAGLEQVDGRLVITGSGASVTDDDVAALRDADHR